MSARWSINPEPRPCSGDMYSGVPSRLPVCVAFTREWRSLAMPKSRILTIGFGPWSGRKVKKMLSGLRSRWMMPLLCAA